jgi:broad specificity phosphatase PhoE
MTRRITLLRHGRTGYSGRYVGARDVPLSAEGCAQISSLRSLFPDQKTEKIAASPMLRCRQSSEILFPDQTVFYDDDLCEIDFGRWEGLSFQEIVKKDPERVDEWAEWSLKFCFPEGECIGHFVERVYRAGARIAAFPEEDIMLIAHGGVIRALLCYFLKLDPSNHLLFQVNKGRFATLELYSEGAVLTGLNLGNMKING